MDESTTRVNILVLSRACYLDLAPYCYQNVVFAFGSSLQLVRFLDRATDLCLANVRYIRYDFGSEARPSLNCNPRKDATWNTVHVQNFASSLPSYPEVSSLRCLEVTFEIDQHFLLEDTKARLTIDNILADESTSLRTIRNSVQILADNFLGWTVEQSLEMDAWAYVRPAAEDEYYWYDKKRLGKVHAGDEFDEAVVYRAVLVLTKP